MNDTQLTTEFAPFAKIPRFSRDIIVTEKIDGSNAQILIRPAWDCPALPENLTAAALVNDHYLFAGSRTRWIRPKVAGEKGDPDNYGFAAWCKENAEELFKLGPGRHFGEWFGHGINRGYGLTDRRFALFNVSRWVYQERGTGFDLVDATNGASGPDCCIVVPILYRGPFDQEKIEECLLTLQGYGSNVNPEFKSPEGIVIFHTASGYLFKKTIKDDESPKSVSSLTDPRTLAAGVDAAKEVFQRRVITDCQLHIPQDRLPE